MAAREPIEFVFEIGGEIAEATGAVNVLPVDGGVDALRIRAVAVAENVGVILTGLPLKTEIAEELIAILIFRNAGLQRVLMLVRGPEAS